MLGKAILERAESHGRATAVVAGGRAASYADLAERTRALIEMRAPDLKGKRVGVRAGSPVGQITAMAALDLMGAHAILLGGRAAEELEQLHTRLRWDHLLEEEEVAAGTPDSTPSAESMGEGSVTILTSGTTAEPKAITHTWSTLARPVRRYQRRRGECWLCAYPLHLYAGIQVLLQALLNGETLACPSSLDPREVSSFLESARVTHASGTPTFWRQLVFFSEEGSRKGSLLRQITLGGEVVSQQLLDLLRHRFPQARIVHIYASTELGRLFSVTDGQEGFPVAYLDVVPDGCAELKIVDGELHARSKNAFAGREAEDRGVQGWFPTGDLVERMEGRILFRGRTTDIINVGGSKVSPAKVEAVLREVKGVADLCVYGKKSSLAGQLVAADVLLAPGAVAAEVRSELARAARLHLATPEAPRIIRFVSELRRTPGFKLLRREA